MNAQDRLSGGLPLSVRLQVKTGMEGSMFLFRRCVRGKAGWHVMRRRPDALLSSKRAPQLQLRAGIELMRMRLLSLLSTRSCTQLRRTPLRLLYPEQARRRQLLRGPRRREQPRAHARVHHLPEP